MNYWWLEDFVFPIILLAFGYVYRFRTPAIGAFTGLATGFIRAREDRWEYAHRLGGLCYLTFGGIAAAYYFVLNIFLGGRAGAALEYPVVIFMLIGIFGTLPFVLLRVKRRFPDAPPGAGE
ncbi:MAG: hypothetical protein Q4C13_04115 [Clostridia bacterium]|nr:hypothetical protein [Clostridia bacterium]